MARMRILGRNGDTTVEWDNKRSAIGDLDAAEALREAERIFEEQRRKGATAFRVEADKPAQKLDAFDRTAEEIVMVPRIAGG